MFSAVVRSACLVVAMLLCIGANAAASPLTVAAAEGRVEYRTASAERWESVSRGDKLTLPGELRTGQDGSARLTQGESELRVRRGSRLALESREARPDGLLERVRQWLGTVFYRVERQPDEFQVETPFLVSTVKGTRFVVVTTDTASFVTLTEGALEVRDLDTGDTRLMAPGDVIESGDDGEGPRDFQPEAPEGDGSGRDSAGAELDALLGEEPGAATAEDGDGAAGDAAIEEALEEIGELEAERRGEEALDAEDGAPLEEDGDFGEDDGDMDDGDMDDGDMGDGDMDDGDTDTDSGEGGGGEED